MSISAEKVRFDEDVMWVHLTDGRILGVGRTADDLAVWTRDCPTTFDDRFAEAVMLPGLIDPHLHPMLAAVLTHAGREPGDAAPTRRADRRCRACTGGDRRAARRPR